MLSSSTKTMIDKLEEEIQERSDIINELMKEEADYKVERISKIIDRVESMPKKIKYETGVSWFDNQCGGFNEGSYINLAGESYGGKTTFALNVLKNISKYNQVLFFSYEMYERLLIDKIGYLDEVQQSNFLIEQKRNELGQIENIIKAYAENGGKFIAIDSRMKIVVSGKKEDYQKNSEISARLSKLCQETGVIIMMINQISESDLKSGRMSLKGSGDQFYDSDVVLFIIVNENDDRTMYCTKDRYGKKWKCKMPDISNNGEEETYFEPRESDLV